MNISLISRTTKDTKIKLIDYYSFFKLIYNTNPNNNIKYYDFSYGNLIPNYINIFNSVFPIEWIPISELNYEKFFDISDCIVLSGEIETNQSLCNQLWKYSYKNHGKIFSYCMKNSMGLRDKKCPVNTLYKYLDNISLREQTSCNKINIEYNNIKLKNYAHQHIDPILHTCYNDWRILIDNRNDMGRNKYGFWINKTNVNNKNNNIDLKNVKITDFFTYFNNCYEIHTDEFQIMLLAIVFNKRCYYYNKKENTFKDFQRLTGLGIDKKNRINTTNDFWNNLEKIQHDSFNYVKNLLDDKKIEKHNYDDLKVFRTNRKNTFNEVLKNENNILCINNLTPYEPKIKSDVCLVTTFYGHDEKRIKATKLALDLMYKYSNPLPGDFVFVEAQKDESECEMKEYCEKYNIQHIYKKIEGCFSREFYFNYGVKFTKLNKLMLTDCDFNFVESDWLKEVSKSLDKYDVIQPFKYFNYANEVKFKFPYLQCSWYQISSGYYNYLKLKYKDPNSLTRKYYNGGDFCGISIGMTRKLFDKIKGELPSPSSMGDGLLFQILLGYNYHNNYLFSSLYEPDETIAKHGLLSQLDDINPVFGFADNICQHIYHGNEYFRCNKGHLIFAMRSNDKVSEDVNITDDNITWKDNDAGQIHSECLKRYSSAKYQIDEELIQDYVDKNKKIDILDRINKIRKQEVYLDANNIYIDVCEEKYGQFTKENPLSIVIVKDKPQFTNNDLCKQKDLIHKYCIVPHDIIVVDKDTLKPFKENCKSTFSKCWVFNAFRDSSCLILSNNCFPLKPFRTFPCKKNTINLSYNSINNKSDCMYKYTWNSDMIYYNGDYSIIYNDYINNQYSTYLSFNEFLLSVLYKHKENIRNLNFYLMSYYSSKEYPYQNNEKLDEMTISIHDFIIYEKKTI